MGNIFDLEAYKACARKAAAEGIVLLKNEGGLLPIAEGTKAALFGRSQFNYYKSGTGSGGMVNVDHVVGIPEGLEEAGIVLDAAVRSAYEDWLVDHPFDVGQGWAGEKWFQEEMPLDEELVQLSSKANDLAIIVIGRTAGEDKDNLVEEGSFLLTQLEQDMLDVVCRNFEKTVVLLNVGNIMDMSWLDRVDPTAVLYTWQGGQEGGNAVADVLLGKVPAGGKLSDTIAYDINDYPSTPYYGDPEENVYTEDIFVGYRYFETFAKDKVRFPFGFGLTYTTFEVKTLGLTADAVGLKGKIAVQVQVTNTGDKAGTEVVQAYVEKPQGALSQPARALVGYVKTPVLAPGESWKGEIGCTWYDLASYDDSGVTGHKSAYVLEAGAYRLYVGTDVRSAEAVGALELAQLEVLEQLTEALAPRRPAERFVRNADGTLGMEAMPLRTVDPMQRRAENIPEEIPYAGDLGYKLDDVRQGKVSLETFVSQLTDEDLIIISRGEGMNSPKVTAGSGGAFGGMSKSLDHFGIPIACVTDGPSGIRLDCGTIAVAMPNGTCLACSFDDALSEELYQWEGLELRRNRVESLLGPGMNIHRNPLNGRNFEYFSEDPLLTGRMAAAQLKGMQKYDVTGTIKHFATNNQEFKRRIVNAVVSERALREIYLKGFEIAVKDGGAYCIMSTYGQLNDWYTSCSYDLLTTILRGEWKYDGLVMTDWWAAGAEEGAVGKPQNTAQMIRAQNDLFMVVEDSETNSRHDNTADGLIQGIVTRAELQRNAMNICRVLLRFPVLDRYLGIENDLDRELEETWSQLDQAVANVRELVLSAEETTIIPAEEIDQGTGGTTIYQVVTPERGDYTLTLKLRSTLDNPLAQLPVSVFMDRNLVHSVTLTGADTEWRTYDLTLSAHMMGRFYLKFFFGLGGLEIQPVEITLKESKEEFFKEMLKKFMG